MQGCTSGSCQLESLKGFAMLHQTTYAFTWKACCPFYQPFQITNHMKKTTLLCVAAGALLGPIGAKSQQFFEPSEVTIRMGERLPESFFDTVHDAVDLKTGTATQVRLGDHRDKLIILDFWATWCGPCIASLNKLDTLKRELQDPRFVVIPVTGQSAREIEPVIKRF